MMKKNNGVLFLSLFLLVCLAACNPKTKKFDDNDSYASGTVSFAADESFSPILDQEFYVFKALNKEAKPAVIYKPENEVLKLFFNDSVRVAIVARALHADELKMLHQKQFYPAVNCFAYDAVAVIVNKASTDTLTSVNELKKILNGQAKTDKNIVFDNANSSLIRYLGEFSGNTKFTQKNIYALKTNVDVIKYVSEHQQAIGFISYSWLLEPDKSYAAWVNNIKVLGVRDEGNDRDSKTYFKPSQNTLAMQFYPLTRGLYIINNTGRPGLGTGFASFLLGEKGQRIVLRSGLLPDSIPTREISFGK
jgi:phosphate transport system substrate-binding protein